METNERLDLVRSDRWIAFDRANIVLNRLTSLMEMPKQSRMPGLMVYGSSGIGKTMIAKRMESLYPTQYEADIGVTRTPILLLQAPPAPDERRFYQHILASIGAPMWGRHTVSELEVRALGRTSKMGNRTLRRLLIIGASAVVRWAEQKGAVPESWLARMLERKPPMLVRVALANSERCSAIGSSTTRTARIVWALMAHGEEYRDQSLHVRAVQTI